MTPPPLSTAPDYESLQTAAARTGFSVDTFRAKIASGELRAYRLSTRPRSAIRVRRVDVDALLQPVIPDAIYGLRHR